jgi:hypothetical protein
VDQNLSEKFSAEAEFLKSIPGGRGWGRRPTSGLTEIFLIIRNIENRVRNSLDFGHRWFTSTFRYLRLSALVGTC